ncbi:Coiled-coil domain-containing protein 43 [Nibea albiflora]|uniref:Coiled-coil domain-containing protein 43 n=1 Tax=Nibea albiflora TaxID=240163 RepID=A0ACB7EX34_NIBAL|nr:Coiled-coil domain-containing protein 43 [Nibea albiflora]
MAAPVTDAGEFESWLNDRLDSLEDEDSVEDVCKQIIKHWTECRSRSAAKRNADDAEVQAIASMIEKQAQIVVKHKEVSEESKKRKEALLAHCPLLRVSALFKNTNVEEVMNRQKQKREQAREDAQKKKETDKMQREKDKLAKQDRKEKEKKRTQKGERKR